MSVILNTPIWVWFLFCFLINRGVSALQSREVQLKRLFVVPLIFLIFGVMHMDNVILFPALLSYLLFAFMFCVIRTGFLWNKKTPVLYDQHTCSVTIPGSSDILLLVLFAFVSKYVLSYLLAEYPYLSKNFVYALIYGADSGIMTGLSWGGLVYVLWCIKHDNH